MNLEKELQNQKMKYPQQCGSMDEVISIWSAIQIAQKYVKEMCKKQRKMTTDYILSSFGDNVLTIDEIEIIMQGYNSPLIIESK